MYCSINHFLPYYSFICILQHNNFHLRPQCCNVAWCNLIYMTSVNLDDFVCLWQVYTYTQLRSYKIKLEHKKVSYYEWCKFTGTLLYVLFIFLCSFYTKNIMLKITHTMPQIFCISLDNILFSCVVEFCCKILIFMSLANLWSIKNSFPS